MKDSRDPSVPPRMALVTTARPQRLTASWAHATTSGCRRDCSHVPVLLLDGHIDSRAGIAGLGLVRQPFDERLFPGQAFGLEVADDQLDGCAVDARLLDVRMHETLIAVGGFG